MDVRLRDGGVKHSAVQQMHATGRVGYRRRGHSFSSARKFSAVPGSGERITGRPVARVGHGERSRQTWLGCFAARGGGIG